MMSRHEFIKSLEKLNISPKEAAKLLSINPKTTTRWLERDAIVPGPAEEAIRAWMRLQEFGLPWRPQDCLIGLTDAEAAEQIRLALQNNLMIDEILQKVKSRSGPAAPWKVDLERCHAELGDTMVVHFYALPDGGFSMSSYSRTDREPNYRRDLPLIEDAVACIAETIKKAKKNWHKRL